MAPALVVAVQPGDAARYLSPDQANFLYLTLR